MIGAGKTSIGKGIARKIDKDFLDLDVEMEGRLGYSYKDLVRDRGWLAFRELEYAICKSFSKHSDAVISLGGGTLRYEWNRDLFQNTGIILLLEAEVNTLIERVRQADRPRVNPGSTLEEDITKLWQDHAETYRSAADCIYRSDEKSLEEEIDELIGMFYRRSDSNRHVLAYNRF